MRRATTACLVPLVVLLALSPSGRAGPVTYTFTPIADSTGMFIDFGATSPSLNNNGTVAFFGSLRAGFAGMFTSTGSGPVQTIALANPAGPITGFFGDSSINNQGTVAFTTLVMGGSAIFAGNGGPLTPVATTIGAPFSSLDNNPEINNRGNVTFQAGLDAGGSGVFLNGPGGLQTVASSAGPPFASFSMVAVNDGDAVAFRAFLDAGNSGIFVAGPGGSLMPIAVTGAGSGLIDVVSPDINESGTVAFIANFVSGLGIFTGNGGILTPIADSNGPYNFFFNGLAINRDGTVAFQAVLDNGGRGIFTGPDPVADRVIAFGDPLFGSTVTDIGFFRGLNDAGQFAFRAQLADGRAFIVRADPTGTVVVPEPSTLALLGFGAFCLAAGRWRLSTRRAASK